MIFRRLESAEEQLGYDVICQTVDWMHARGIKLWDRPLPRAVYSRRHERGENYALWIDSEVAAIVSLVSGPPEYWLQRIADPKAIWLCTLAVASSHHGRGIGAATVEAAVQHLAAAGHVEVWLDCKPGYLEAFYERLGYQPVVRQTKVIPHAGGGTFDVTLMRRTLK